MNNKQLSKVYIDRNTGDRWLASHYIRGISSTTLSIPVSQINPDDVLEFPSLDGESTPATLWNGVYYFLDE